MKILDNQITDKDFAIKLLNEKFNLEKENEKLKLEILELKSDIKNLVSLNLWSARRMGNSMNKHYTYDEIEKVTGETYERL